MVLVRMLKRKDAASVVVAVVVGFIIYAFLSTIAEPLADKLVSRNPSLVSGDWQTQYLFPAVLAAIELVALEVLSRIYIWAGSLSGKK